MQSLRPDAVLLKVKHPAHVVPRRIGNAHAVEKGTVIAVRIAAFMQHGEKEIFMLL